MEIIKIRNYQALGVWSIAYTMVHSKHFNSKIENTANGNNSFNNIIEISTIS